MRLIHLRGATRPDDGASSVEYGLLIAGIAALITAVVFLFGGQVRGLFDQTCTAISTGGRTNVTVSC